jgi:transposase InsO family protein
MTAYYPQSNGMTERFNKTVLDMVCKYIANDFGQGKEVLGQIASTYRILKYSSKIKSPYFFITARDPNKVVDRF